MEIALAALALVISLDIAQDGASAAYVAVDLWCCRYRLAWVAAMRQGGKGGGPAVADSSMVPTIIFHGDGDTTVHPDNAVQIVEHAIGARKTRKKKHRGQIPGGHGYTRTTHTDGDDCEILEHWTVHGASHAWSGGSPAGSFTDGEGPDATKEMMRFFLEHPRAPRP